MLPLRSGPNLPAQLELLSHMIEDISGELAQDPLLTRIVERACKLIGADDGLIGLYVPGLDVLRIAAGHNIPPSELRSEVPRGYGLTGHVLQLEAPFRGYYRDLPLPSANAPRDMHVIGMPIRMRGRLIGAFGIGVQAPRTLDAHAQDLLDVFARHAAIAIDNAQRYDEERRRAARFALIARVAGIIASAPELDSLLQRAADAIHELLEYQNVDIPLIEADDPGVLVIRVRGGHYKHRIRHVDRLPVTQGVMGSAFTLRRTQVVNDVASDARYVTPPGVRPPTAELAIPILHGDEALGVLNVEGDHVFDELDRASLEIVAEHLGVAIVNARLFDQGKKLALLEERQRLARNLHDNVTQILSSVSLIAQSLPAAWQRDAVDADRRATRLAELARLGLGELRSMLHELSPPPAKYSDAPESRPLPSSLGQLLRAMVPPHVQLQLDIGDWPPQAHEHEETIRRVCQEAVSNAVRHADPSTIEVAISASHTELRLRVTDDGRGIGKCSPRGMGLDNMRQRLGELGGKLRITSRRPNGTQVVAHLPRMDRHP